MQITQAHSHIFRITTLVSTAIGSSSYFIFEVASQHTLGSVEYHLQRPYPQYRRRSRWARRRYRQYRLQRDGFVL